MINDTLRQEKTYRAGDLGGNAQRGAQCLVLTLLIFMATLVVLAKGLFVPDVRKELGQDGGKGITIWVLGLLFTLMLHLVAVTVFSLAFLIKVVTRPFRQ
ncbi:MAG: hypothetical protein ABIB97_01200 [Patescibacteria group bacterium]